LSPCMSLVLLASTGIAGHRSGMFPMRLLLGGYRSIHRASPDIIVMEVLAIMVTCWQVLKSRKLRRETLYILAEWETQRNNHSSARSGSTETACESTRQKITACTSTRGSRRGEIYTMNALEKALQTNSTSLLLFAALKDFSEENISVLDRVRDWKADWSPSTDRFKVLKKS